MRSNETHDITIERIEERILGRTCPEKIGARAPVFMCSRVCTNDCSYLFGIARAIQDLCPKYSFLLLRHVRCLIFAHDGDLQVCGHAHVRSHVSLCLD